MSLILFGFGPSRSFRCLWALQETGVDFRYIELDMSSDREGGVRSQKYLEMNPEGKVPTLIHDDFVLRESGAILNYIDTLSDQSFIPSESAQKRARYDQLSYFVLTELEQPLWTTGKHKFAIPEEHRVDDIFSTATWEFTKALSTLDREVDYAGYMIGDDFTFADILVAHTLEWADRFKFSLEDQHLAYRDRMFERIACQKARATK